MDFIGPYVTDGVSLFFEEECIQTLPCKHCVLVNGDKTTMSALEIYTHMLKSGKGVHTHFLYVQFWVNSDGSWIRNVDIDAYRAWFRNEKKRTCVGHNSV